MQQAPERKRPGRKPLPEGQGKLARIELRTTPERKAKAERLAAAAGLSLAGWWERAVDKARE
jgi:predicted HicB family RNase H-like nuclease